VVSSCGIAGRRVDTVRARRIGPCTVVGDFASDCRDRRLYSHKIALVAALMAGALLEIEAEQK
jgi:sulfur carrier protein ThiS adenylyltransferase